MGESLISFEQHITTMFTSGSKITAVARNTFLDWKIKAECQRLNAEEVAHLEVEVLEVTCAAEKPPSPSKVHVEKKLHWNAEDASSSGGSDFGVGGGGGVGGGVGSSDAEAGEAAAESAEAKAAGGVIEVMAKVVPATIIDRDHPSAEEAKAAAEVEAARLAAEMKAAAEAAAVEAAAEAKAHTS